MIEQCRADDREFLRAMLASLRPTDRLEIHCLTDGLEEELFQSVKNSAECYKVQSKDGRPYALFGAVLVPGEDGALIWCVCSVFIREKWLSFARESRRILRRWVKEYGVRYNVVAGFDSQAVAWLSWCGARLFEPNPLGRHGEMFRRFEIRKEETACAASLGG